MRWEVKLHMDGEQVFFTRRFSSQYMMACEPFAIVSYGA